MSYGANKNSFWFSFSLHSCELPVLVTPAPGALFFQLFFFIFIRCRREKCELKILWNIARKKLLKNFTTARRSKSSEFMETKINISQLIYFATKFTIGSYVIIRWGSNEMCIIFPERFSTISRAFLFASTENYFLWGNVSNVFLCGRKKYFNVNSFWNGNVWKCLAERYSSAVKRGNVGKLRQGVA